MKLAAVVSSLLISLVMAFPALEERDVTLEGLWKRDCPGNPVAKPVCIYGFYAVGSLPTRSGIYFQHFFFGADMILVPAT